MLKKYSYWETADGTEGAFYPGEEYQPQFFDDEADAVIRFYVIEAETMEEAQAIHYLRRGFAPYYPMGEPIKCPNCSNYYYRGSGQCYCGFDSNKEI